MTMSPVVLVTKLLIYGFASLERRSYHEFAWYRSTVMNPHISLPKAEPPLPHRNSNGPHTFSSISSLAPTRRTGSFTSLSSNYSGNASFNAGSSASRSNNMEQLRMPRFFKRLFKWPQMDFEMAAWEMRSLIISPRDVFRTIYYNVWTINLKRKR